MAMEGHARAPAAGTVLNALATGTGCAFAIDLETRAWVELTEDGDIVGEITEDETADSTLIETCVAHTLDRVGANTVRGGFVRTESDVPMASGLKSSSAAANATVLATLDALRKTEKVDRLEATRIGVEAAREAGVTVTGAFDDASASMLGGITRTDNSTDRLLSHEAFDRAVAVYTPPERAYSADADVDACRRIAIVADVIADLAAAGEYEQAMTINGFGFSAALGFSAEPMLLALAEVDGVSLSGTGPSTVAVGANDAIERVATKWESLPGMIRITKTHAGGAHT